MPRSVQKPQQDNPSVDRYKGVQTRQVALSAIGFSLLVGVVAWIGPATLLSQFYQLRWVLPLLVSLGLVKNILRTWAWKKALEAEGVVLEFRYLLKVRIASQALAYLASMGALISEPLKPWLLREAAPVERTIPSTLVEAAVYWVVSLFVTTLGAFVAIRMMTSQYNIFLLSLTCLIIFSAVVVLLFARNPLVPKVVGFVARRTTLLRPRWLSVLDKAGEMEAQMRSFRLRHAGTMGTIVGIDVVVQIVMFMEIWMILFTLGIPLTLSQLVVIEAAGRVVKMVSFYVPGRLGADEAGASAAFLLMGLSPLAGVTLAVARRVQALFWAALGVVLLMRADAPTEFRTGSVEESQPGLAGKALSG